MEDLYRSDAVLQRYVKLRLPEGAEAHLSSFGELCTKEIAPRAVLADKYSPKLIQYDAEGNRVDEMEYHPSYSEMEKLAYEYGLVHRFYEPPLAGKRLLGFALGYLFGQAESGLFCPVCMTDGVAFVLSRHGTEELKRAFLPKLLSRTREGLFQGAMFLTEKEGGSDVGQVATRAVPFGDAFKLYGEKWFCSNVDAEAILILAREEGARSGTRGLSLFLLPKTLESGERNAYLINRIKEKLGVRSMPTGEVTLQGAIAYRVGEREGGFKLMAEMLNLSRLYNAIASVSCLRRALFEATAHAGKRVAFGRKLQEHPLMQRKLVELQTAHESSFYFVFAAVAVMDRLCSGLARPHDAKLLRILTPLIKYWTAKRAVAAASEAVEVLGGNGYIEDFVTPRLLRDAQVLPIWEGATNILVLDAFRAIAKEAAHEALWLSVEENLRSVHSEGLKGYAQDLWALEEGLQKRLPQFAHNFEEQAFYAQDFTDALALLVQGAEWLAVEEEALARGIGGEELGSGAKLSPLKAFFALELPQAHLKLERVKMRRTSPASIPVATGRG